MSAVLDLVLSEVVRVRSAGGVPIVVLDLDSTLFDTAPRNLRILREFAGAHVGRPEVAAAVDRLRLDDMGWNVMGSLEAAGVDDAELLGALKVFWMNRFFTDEYLGFDEPTPGAAAYCVELWNAGAVLYYLTGRHVGGMELGTLRSLVRHGFPWGSGRTVMHLKPCFEDEDETFKQDAIRAIEGLNGEVVAAFENEPINCNMLHRAWPGAVSCFLDTVHSPRPDRPHEGASWLKDFRR